MKKLTEEVYDAWIAALRSGNYNQGTGLLCFDDNFCCLGVLGDILEIPPERMNTNYLYVTNEFGQFRDKIVPEHIAIKYLTEIDIIQEYTSIQLLTLNFEHFLATMNDTGGLSFSEIADILSIPEMRQAAFNVW